MPDGSAWATYREHGDESSHSKVFNSVTLYRIPKSVCLFSQVASPVFNKNASFFANKQNPISYKSFLLLNLLLLQKSREKEKLIFQAPFLLLPLVKYRSCTVINNISNWLNLAAFFVQGESQEGGIIQPVLKAYFWQPAFDLLQASPSVPLFLHSISRSFALHSLRTMPSLWPISAAHPPVWAIWSI